MMIHSEGSKLRSTPRHAFLAAIMLMFPAADLHAAIAFGLDSSLQTVQPGQTATFTGMLTNTESGVVFLNGDSYTFPLTVDDTPFFLTPVSLGPGDSFTGVLFNVVVGPATSPGLYTGVFDVLGGPTLGSNDVIASSNFGVQVVPEPSTVYGALSGLALLGLDYLRRLRRQQSQRFKW
jgi:hypothetical protein